MKNEPVAYENTDKEIWRAIPDDYYSPSIFVTKENNIGINVGGHVYVKTVEQWHKNTHPVKELTDETELLETEIFVKDAIIKCYKEALEQIATGEIAGESNNYKDTVYVMRQIASDALAILRKAQEK